MAMHLDWMTTGVAPTFRRLVRLGVGYSITAFSYRFFALGGDGISYGGGEGYDSVPHESWSRTIILKVSLYGAESGLTTTRGQ